jgi:hypothetical protein
MLLTRQNLLTESEKAGYSNEGFVFELNRRLTDQGYNRVTVRTLSRWRDGFGAQTRVAEPVMKIGAELLAEKAGASKKKSLVSANKKRAVQPQAEKAVAA